MSEVTDLLQWSRRSGVYAIVNKRNNKTYVGSAVNIRQRLYDHRRLLDLNKHGNQRLQRAWNKYGRDAFSFFVLEEVERLVLVSREQHYIDTLQTVTTGYNIAPLAGSTLGVPCAPETKRKIGTANSGRAVTEATRQKLRGQNIGNKFATALRGIKRSDETRRKMSMAQKGNQKGLGNRSNTGRRIPDEQREKIRTAMLGRNVTTETRVKLSKALTGRTFSAEHCRNISEAKKRATAIRKDSQAATDDRRLVQL